MLYKYQNDLYWLLLMRIVLLLGTLVPIGCSDLPQTAPKQGGDEASSYSLTNTVMPEQNCNTAYMNAKLVGSRILHPSAKVCFYL